MSANRTPSVANGGGLAVDVPSGAIGTELAQSHPPNQPAFKSWRDVLPVHLAAERFPMMAEAELKQLGHDIKKKGLQQPITVWRDGDNESAAYTLLDGRNRLTAMELVGMTVVGNPEAADISRAMPDVSITIVEPPTNPFAFVMSANIRRRHLTAEKKAEVIAELIKLDPTKSNRQIAKQTNFSPTTVGKVRDKLEEAGDVSIVDTRADTMGRQQHAHKPAPKPVPEAPQPVALVGPAHAPEPEAKPVSRAPMFDDEVQQPAHKPRSAGNGVDPAASAEARKAQVADAETDVAAEATTPVKPPTPPDLAAVPENAEPKPNQVSKEALWLWGWLREFECEDVAKPAILDRDPKDIMATLPPNMLDDVHRLAPLVAKWLEQIGAIPSCENVSGRLS